jgi:hypothetical protein
VTGRRLLTLLVVLAAVGIPAGVLQALCAGRSCDSGPGEAPRIPFCPLPAALREAISNGYREGRSPDVLGIARDVPVYTEIGGLRIPWPATGSLTDTRVPLVFSGAGVSPGADLPNDVTLDAIAPTVSEILAFDRPFPDVRSGTAVDGVFTGSAATPRLVLLIAWKGVGSAELEDLDREWPHLASLMETGAGTLEARTGSLPLDPAATLATIGTGGLPSQHGITGSFVRNDEGDVVRAFGDGAPVQVIATLADDLEEASDGRALVGIVATDERDLGLVGGGWYPDQDPVDVVIGDGEAMPLAVDVHLGTGYGADEETDVLGVVMDGGIRRLDGWTERVVRAAERATNGSVLVVIAGTGTWERSRVALPETPLVDAVEDAVPGSQRVVAAIVAGGLFLDQEVLTESSVTGQVAVDAMLDVTTPQGREMMADAFQGFAVSFARYC